MTGQVYDWVVTLSDVTISLSYEMTGQVYDRIWKTFGICLW